MDGIDWAASAMAAARTRLDIATANLANVSSDGFHAVLARGKLTAHGVEIARITAPDHGAYRHTGRATDFAIVGEGAFRVRAADGTIGTTRNGAFERDRRGVLRDCAGRALIGTMLGPGASVRSGFLETSDVNAIDEMVNVLTSQRAFESAEKVVAAIDGVRRKSSNDVAQVK
ncbi:MAG TPA: flagellar basal body rod C-terminal domain-containing protein [Candidatus Baltobacteraceae bacterium]|nr:flagellar basal body rod C-terminal domain-containing protein [Candidatus Baltobacteraceae bacterium]